MDLVIFTREYANAGMLTSLFLKLEELRLYFIIELYISLQTLRNGFLVITYKSIDGKVIFFFN